jgi:ubiquinone/menaquinone biosynthesis C-methylase UbiE
MPVKDSTRRFSSRVQNYIRYRPGYPPEVIELLKNECGLTATSVIVDIGSGTGILTRILLENGNSVFAVEPNPDMRAAAESALTHYSTFTSVNGTAEAMSLAEHSVNLVIAAQAAHWFERNKARREFVRILKPGGWTVLLWNERQTDTTPFLRDYEGLLLKYGTDYQEIRHERTTAEIADFFAPASFEERVFENVQDFDYSGVEGRLLSSSYVPMAGHPTYGPMISELQRIVDSHQQNGRVRFEYLTRVYYGQL